MQIDYALTQYLHLYGNLPLPGMGHLSVRAESATLSFPERKIFEPVKKISFSPLPVADKHLTEWLSAEFETDYEKASELLKDWATDFRQKIKNRSTLIWHGVGRIYSSSKEGELLFETIDDVSDILQYGITAEKVIRTGHTHTVLVGESEKSSGEMEEALKPKTPKVRKYWPVVVLMLLVLGFTAIWVIVSTYPQAWKRKGNQSQISVKESPSRFKWIP
ncbi:MAG: hypothetical protein ACK50E_05560 [Bacteroidota bacterium]